MLKKVDEEMRKKNEEAETARALRDFEATFQQSSKLDRTWVKGGVVHPGTDDKKVETVTPTVYKPTSKFDHKTSKNLEVGKVESKADGSKKPIIGKKQGQNKKMSNLELFKEELKNIQKQREQRHQLRQQNKGKADVKLPADVPSSEFSLDLDDLDKKNRMREYGYPYDEDSDKSTTNLFLGNLCPQMTEQQLCEIFGRYGPLASVKIMWPRTEEQRAVARNCGFVAFMNRVDAERALENLRGKELLGYEMKLGWGKTVPIPVYPVYIPPPLLELIKPPSQSGLPFNAQPREWLKSLRSSIKERAKLVTDSIGNGDSPAPSIPPAPDRFPFNIHTMSKENFSEVLQKAVVKVVIPSDRTILATIHRLIEFVAREGPQFESAIMHREEKNVQYKFLFDYQTPEHLYYRWKLWSILHGESVNKWSLEEFRMYETGPLWRPPPINFFTNGMPEDLVEKADYPFAPGYTAGRNDDLIEPDVRDDAVRRGGGCGGTSGEKGICSGCLTEAQRGRITIWISDLEPSRAQIGDVMVWCLEHADAAGDIVEVIVKSLKRPSLDLAEGNTGFKRRSHEDKEDFKDVLEVKPATSIQAVVARLYLTSDILYNSGAKVPNASYYRRCFEGRLFEMFTDVRAFYCELDSKLKTEQLKQLVMNCFRAWEDWAIYPIDFLVQLQNVFLGLTPNTTTNNSVELAAVSLTSDAGAKNAVVMTVPSTPDIESLDGAPLVQYDGDPLDVDGSPLTNVGEDVDDDFEGVPLDIGSTKSSDSNNPQLAPTTPLFVPSKWESVDPGKDVEEAVTSNRWDLFIGGVQPNLNENPLMKKDEDEEDVDGKPLDGFGAVGLGLVAYDDDDALSPVSTPTAAASAPMSESRRQALRGIEVKVVKYQDELEACRKKGESVVTDEAIDKQVERFRERLLERLGDCKDSIPSPTHKSSKPGSTNKLKQSSKRHFSSSTKRYDSRSPPRSMRSSRKRHSKSPIGIDAVVVSQEKRLREEPSESREEGEASDDETGNAPSLQKKSKIRDEESRHRDRSPRRSRRSRSRTPSPSRWRSGTGTPGRSQKRK